MTYLAASAVLAGLAVGASSAAPALASNGASAPKVPSSTTALVEPRYVVELVDFYCGDESGADWSGSDEPYWIATAKQGTNNVRTWRSPVWGDIDSGNRRVFSTSFRNNVVWPSTGSSLGATGPVALSIQLWEDDLGGSVTEVVAETVKDLDLTHPTGAPMGPDDWKLKVGKVVVAQLLNMFKDDMMGSQTIAFSSADLAGNLPAAGVSMTRSYHFSGKGGDLPVEIAGGPDYDLKIKVTRVA